MESPNDFTDKDVDTVYIIIATGRSGSSYGTLSLPQVLDFEVSGIDMSLSIGTSAKVSCHLGFFIVTSFFFNVLLHDLGDPFVI